MRISGQTVPFDTLLMAGVADRLSILVWAKTKDGQKGKNRPPMMVDALTKKEPKETDVVAFSSGEDFEEARNNLIGKISAGGEI